MAALLEVIIDDGRKTNGVMSSLGSSLYIIKNKYGRMYGLLTRSDSIVLSLMALIEGPIFII